MNDVAVNSRRKRFNLYGKRRETRWKDSYEGRPMIEQELRRAEDMNEAQLAEVLDPKNMTEIKRMKKPLA